MHVVAFFFRILLSAVAISSVLSSSQGCQGAECKTATKTTTTTTSQQQSGQTKDSLSTSAALQTPSLLGVNIRRLFGYSRPCQWLIKDGLSGYYRCSSDFQQTELLQALLTALIRQRLAPSAESGSNASGKGKLFTNSKYDASGENTLLGSSIYNALGNSGRLNGLAVSQLMKLLGSVYGMNVARAYGLYRNGLYPYRRPYWLRRYGLYPYRRSYEFGMNRMSRSQRPYRSRMNRQYPYRRSYGSEMNEKSQDNEPYGPGIKGSYADARPSSLPLYGRYGYNGPDGY